METVTATSSVEFQSSSPSNSDDMERNLPPYSISDPPPSHSDHKHTYTSCGAEFDVCIVSMKKKWDDVLKAYSETHEVPQRLTQTY